MTTPTPREAADVERMAGVVREAVHQNGTLKDYLCSATTRAVAHAALDHARTASGDDHGRELAEVTEREIGDLYRATWPLSVDADADVNALRTDAEVLRGMGVSLVRTADLRALAAPAETEAFTDVDADTWPDAVLATALGRVGAAATVDEALSLCNRVTRELDRFDMVVAARPDLAMNTPGAGTSPADRRRVYAAVRDLLDEDDHGLPPGSSDAVIRLTSKAMRRALHEPTASTETEVVIEAFARHRHEATGRDMHNGRNIRPDGDARGASPIGLCTWAEAPEDWREGYRELCRHDAGLAGTPPPPEAVTTAEVIAWHRARFGGDPADVLVMGKLAEEAGEVCGAITKRAEGAVRPAKGLVTREDWSAHLLDEVGDVGIVLHTLCAREGTTLDEVVTRRFRDDVALRTGQEAPPEPSGETARGEHAAVDGDRPFREQTAGDLGLTRGTRSDGDAAHWAPGGEQP